MARATVKREFKRAPTGKKMSLDEFRAQYGEGYNKLEDFLGEWDQFNSWPNEPDPDNVERLQAHVGLLARAIRGYMDHEFESLDDALKVRRPDNYSRPAARRRHLHLKELQTLASHLRRHGVATNDRLFEFLGRQFHISTGTAKRWYYLSHKSVDRDPSKSKDDIATWARDQLDWKD